MQTNGHDAKYYAHVKQCNAQMTNGNEEYQILTCPAFQLGDFEDWSIIAVFTRSFISCSVCNPFEGMSSAAIASNISPMSSISSMLFVLPAAILNEISVKFENIEI